ncbi:hypothetical protein LSH36_825g03040 [Paralvinella palmiformis]|uniref:Uncharacterized protein n=1 Tax=Paralvinella palmiformis TaxID=53620 RepID=A0AAD9J0D6_9ANNE|nr:hypothetical protein LSH36_825g03040 [Paralvinella palmiformis]
MALDNAAINSRLLIILVIIVGLISAVGITISAVALGRPSAPDISISTNNHPISADWLAAGTGVQLTANSISKRDLGLKYSRQHEKRQANSIWMLAFGNDNGAHDYRSEDGTIQGFGVDLVEAVCAIMDLQCRLFGQWYDGCVGWSPTRDRLNVFNFSPSYTKPSTSKLFVKTGNNKRVADLLNGAIGLRGAIKCDDE